ncbi:MAG: magnesium chelatase ATPase subunit D, partial [Gammaproteobacteria bacterium]
MTAPPGYDPGPWQEAVQAAYLLAIEPRLGAVLRARPGPAREAWLRLLAGLLPDAPWQRVPAQVDAAGLLGGLDLAATLAAGRPLATRGVLAAADGGCVVLATAERLGATALGIIAGALDTQSVTLERDGMTRHCAARFAVVALDESYADEAPLATALADRLALVLALDGVRVAAGLDELPDPAAVVAARAQLPSVRADDAHIEALVAAAAALGIGSLRPLQAAVLAARAAAALDGATRLDEAHLALAVRLVLLPRARCVPGDAAADTEPAEAPPPEAGGDTTPRDDAAPPPPADEGADAESSDAAGQGAPEDAILAAAAAALPAGLLAQIARLGAAGSGARAGRASGRARAPRRGRPIGSRPGQPRGGARLDLVATLRAAAPWQRLRAQAAAPRARVAVREEDFRVTRFKARTVITTIFVVDASGSSAAHRLAEAKGAVELLLA